MHNRPTHFEIHASDPEKVAEFYKNVFGWEVAKWDGPMEYWMVMTAPKGSTEPGINGGLIKRMNPEDPIAKPQRVSAFVLTIQTENYDEIHEKILANGGMVALPKTALVGMAWQGYYLDNDKNLFGLHQTDTNAK